jgi:membrane protein DedA with SNARE-associated domain
VSIVPLHLLETLLHEYGYGVVFLGLLLESMGAPLPGESLMIAAALYAATGRGLNIFVLVPVAAAGAICGDQIGYAIGRWIGFRVLRRWGGKVGLSAERLDLGRFLFRRYGGRVVFIGRFVAILRTFAALLAGANRMAWHRFLFWNALGGIAWTSLYGFGAYALGDAAKQVSGTLGITLGVAGAAGLIALIVYVRRHEHRLMAAARQEMQHAAPRSQAVAPSL